MERARVWGLWVCLAAGLLLAAWAVSVRDPLPADAPADVFSAGRAMADVRLIGREPHPIGSPADDRVRQALVARMEALGLRPQVRDAVGLHTPKTAPDALGAGIARSVLGVLPGTDPAAPALLVMAHFDSVPNSPGAADDAAGVASALEIARLLIATGPHRRDVLILLTDGEEAGLLGAEAFFSGDPLRAHVGAVVNLEARGDAGRASMFETGRDDAGMIALYAAHARAPFANSLTAFLYHRLPNNTDFSEAYAAGLPGLNFAFLGDQLAYHTPLSTPGHLSQQTLQHMGDQAAPVARALADAAALPARGPDVAYFDLFGRTLVRYPASAGWLAWGAGALLLAGAWARLHGRGAGSTRQALQGAAAALAATAGAALAGHVAGRLLDGAGYAAGYHLYRAYDLLFAGAGLLAIGAALAVYAAAARGRGVPWVLAAALVAALLSLIHGFDAASWIMAAVAAGAAAFAARGALSAGGAWVGALLLVGLLAGAVQLAAPLAAPLTAWPFLLGALAAAIWSLAPASTRPAAAAVVGVLAVVTFGALGALAEAMFATLGPALPEVLAIFVMLSLPVLAPFAVGWSGARRPGATAAAALAIGAASLLAVGFGTGSVARPALADALYLVPAEGPQRRVAPIPDPLAWGRAVLGADGGRIVAAPIAPLFPFPVWQAPARSRPVTPPVVRLERDGAIVRLTALAAGGGRAMRLFLRSTTPIVHVAVNGRASPLSAAPSRWAVAEFAAPPATGVTLAFAAPAGARVEARVFEQRDGWPPGAQPPPKPSTAMAWRDSDTTLVEARASLP